jgi:Malonate decarboxylase, alpha subunit, transporter/Malonate decarboxylase gamma subunit (MdcE)
MFDKQAIRNGKLAKVRQAFGEGKVIVTERSVELLETVIEPGNRIILEGDNQKQGDFLAARLARMNPKKVYGLKLCVSSVGLEAISRVTKMPLDKLQALSAKVSVFAPGSENFYKMGDIYEMWTDQFPARLEHLMVSDISKDLRARLGHERGGREAAQSIIEDVLRA